MIGNAPAAGGPASPSATGEPPYVRIVVDSSLTVSGIAFGSDEAEAGEDEGWLQRAFHYAIPQALRGRLRLGQRVWVPFGGRQLQGIVIGFDERSPVAETREVLSILDDEPALSPEQLALGQWISVHYLTPLHAALFAMVPPGLQQRAAARYESTHVPPHALKPTQQRLYDLLREQGPLTAGELGRLAPTRHWRTHLRPLLAAGYVQQTITLQPPSVRPHYETLARLTEPDRQRWPDGRAVRQWAVLELLALRREQDAGWTRLADLRQQAGASPAILRALADKALVEVRQEQVWRDPLAGTRFVPITPPQLTPDQEAAWQVIAADLEAPARRPFLLQGVTGSGKTELYLRAVARALAQGRSAIVLVPEIALTPQTIRRFGARFPELLAVLHGALSPGERYDQWRRIRAGELRVVVGARSAIFAPVQRLGVVVVDEEHEWTYKQDQQAPHYHAREVAIERARLAGATVVLGSATPDLATYHRARQGEVRRVALPRRVMGHRAVIDQLLAESGALRSRYVASRGDALYAELPQVQVVDMRAELRAGHSGMFSRPLDAALRQTLAADEQAILFINRRGTASAVICRDCGHVIECPRCHVAMAYHERPLGLLCHHCGRREPVPQVCPQCGGRRIRYLSAGTERVESEVQRAYAQAVTLRWDSDTATLAQDHDTILGRFVRREANVLVGTQMVAKGLDLPRVTLVGVVLADISLHLPDLYAGERTFQLLTQVAGRAGRSVLPGRVIIQTYQPEHPAIQAAAQHDYEGFAEAELAFRRAQGYPPYRRLARLEYVDASAARAQGEAERLAALLNERIALLGLYGVDVIGPTPPYFQRARGRWRWQLLVRGPDPSALLSDLRLPLGWRVDIDPVSLV